MFAACRHIPQLNMSIFSNHHLRFPFYALASSRTRVAYVVVYTRAHSRTKPHERLLHQGIYRTGERNIVSLAEERKRERKRIPGGYIIYPYTCTCTNGTRWQESEAEMNSVLTGSIIQERKKEGESKRQRERERRKERNIDCLYGCALV